MKLPPQTIILAALILLPWQNASCEDKKLWADSIINQKAPELKAEEWLTPKPETAGKFVLVDFWATWCPPCRKAVSELNGYQTLFKDRLVIIGISDEPKEKVSGFSNPKPLYSLALDSKNETAKSIKVSGIPHVLLIDPSGIVRWEGFPFLSGHELTADVIADVINRFGDAPGSASKEQKPGATP